MEIAFVTGAASGIGRALTLALLERGYRVIAADIDVAALAALPAHDHLATRALDVRSTSAVAAVGLEVGPVDLVVNNAGIGVWATQEHGDPDAIRDLFDVNVLGPMRVTRAFLGSLRARRGTIVQISSISGRVVFPESGFYAATKHALEAMSEALYQEVAPDGVRVRVIQPGSFLTGFQAAAATRSGPPVEPYATRRATWDARRDAVLAPAQPPERVAEAVLASLADPAGFLRVPVGDDAVRVLTLREQLTPDEWVRLMAERNGANLGDGSPIADPRDPHRVTDARRLANTFTALTLGHLDHWQPRAVAAWRAVWRSRFAGI